MCISQNQFIPEDFSGSSHLFLSAAAIIIKTALCHHIPGLLFKTYWTSFQHIEDYRVCRCGRVIVNNRTVGGLTETFCFSFMSGTLPYSLGIQSYILMWFLKLLCDNWQNCYAKNLKWVWAVWWQNPCFYFLNVIQQFDNEAPLLLKA